MNNKLYEKLLSKDPIGAFDKSSNGYKDYMALKIELEGILNGRK